MTTGRAIGEAGPPLLKTYSQPRPPKPLRPVNPARRARLEERNFGPHGAWIRTQPCVVATYVHPSLRTDCGGDVRAAHLVPRGMGGCGGDRFSLFPACDVHHGEQEGRTAEFQTLYGLDLAVLVEHYNLADSRGITEDEREAARLRLGALNELGEPNSRACPPSPIFNALETALRLTGEHVRPPSVAGEEVSPR
jgi:hypothetical protein